MTKVHAVPAGYGTVTPFLNVKGASEALEFYKKAFGAEERARLTGPNGTIMHGEMKIGTSIVMIGEAMMNAPTTTSLHIFVEDCDALWARATGAGCKVEMPLADQFWGDRYGVLSDKFGNRWSIASRKEELSSEEMQKRGVAAMAAMMKK